MACSTLPPPSQLVLSLAKTTHLKLSLFSSRVLISNHNQSFLAPQCFSLKGQITSARTPLLSTQARPSLDKSLDQSVKVNREYFNFFEKVVFKYPFWSCVVLSWLCICTNANAASGCLRASGIGRKFAEALRGFGWSDEVVVFVLATLPVIELRGAIPAGYWFRLNPILLTILSVLGNMVPVPFILLYMKKLATFLALKSPSSKKVIQFIYDKAKKKAGPIEEFHWLGLMLFVAVPCPGTGAWTGAFIASVLNMPFWSALSANFIGVVLAGLQVNLIMNIGVKYAILMCLFMYAVSTLMWSVLRKFTGSKNPSSTI